MRRSLKFTLFGLGVVALLGAAPFALERIVIKIGESSIRELAREGNFCTTDDCKEGIDYTLSFLETNYALSAENVKWCMGVDVIAHYNLPFGAGLKTTLTDMMYERCGDPRNDEPAEDYPPE